MGNFDASTRGFRPGPLYNFKRGLYQLGNTNLHQIYVNGTEGKQRVKALMCNIDAVDQTVSLYHVPSGGTPGPTYCSFPPTTLQPNEAGTPPWEFFLEGGDSIYAQASAANVINVQLAIVIET